MDLGDWLWAMLALFFWFMCIWIFVAVFADIFRRHDISGPAKAGWILLIFVLPLLGPLIYVIARPRLTEEDRQRATSRYDAGRDTSYLDPTSQVPGSRAP
jgi:phospholipase D-like protein